MRSKEATQNRQNRLPANLRAGFGLISRVKGNTDFSSP
jgi:hypothetical protein